MAVVDLAAIVVQDQEVAARKRNLGHVHMSAEGAQGSYLKKSLIYFLWQQFLAKLN
jgi:hypothetical protein